MKKHRGIIMIVSGLLLTIIGLWPIGIPLSCIGPIFLIFDIKANYYTPKESKKGEKVKKATIKATNSEADFQRWKAEREKQTREP